MNNFNSNLYLFSLRALSPLTIDTKACSPGPAHFARTVTTRLSSFAARLRVAHALHQPSSTWYRRDLNQGNWYATHWRVGAWCSHGTCELNRLFKILFICSFALVGVMAC